MDKPQRKHRQPAAEFERLRYQCGALIRFLEHVNPDWLDTTARQLTEDEIRQQLRSGQLDSLGRTNSRTSELSEIFGQGFDVSGMLHSYVVTRALIEAGAAIIELVDEVSSATRTGHDGRPVIGPTRDLIEKVNAARLAADVCGTATILMATTFAKVAQLVVSDVDARDREFIRGEPTPAGLFHFSGSLRAAIVRALAHAPYADVLCFESSTVDLSEAKAFAASIHAQFPKHLLAYNCSSLYKQNQLDDSDLEEVQRNLGRIGYVLQFGSLGGFASLST